MLISLLTSCSCEKKTDLENISKIQSSTNQEVIEIKIIDPFIDNDIDFSKQVNYPRSSKIKSKKNTPQKNQNKLTKKPKSKSDKIDHQDLELISYESGLKYQILRHGPSNSPLPTKGQTACAHYIGWHNDNGEPGELIDSTYERNLPFEFKVGEKKVIPAWDQAVMDMRVGDKWRLFIPSELAWGQAGATILIPSNTDLIYEIEIISIK